MESARVRDSGVFDPHEAVTPKAEPWDGATGEARLATEPETFVLAAAWALALLQIGVGVVRGGAFGPDHAIALAFAIACPLVVRGRLADLGKRARARLQRAVR